MMIENSKGKLSIGGRVTRKLESRQGLELFDTGIGVSWSNKEINEEMTLDE